MGRCEGVLFGFMHFVVGLKAPKDQSGGWSFTLIITKAACALKLCEVRKCSMTVTEAGYFKSYMILQVSNMYKYSLRLVMNAHFAHFGPPRLWKLLSNIHSKQPFMLTVRRFAE